MDNDFNWWRNGIIYQIYPRSYCDSNGDGFGDLPGIISRLDYLAWLGIDAIWLSPIYPSPDADFGYDISDYTEIDSRFGSLADFDSLVTEAHRRGIRIVLDMVLNHTSDQHPWFVESRSSRDNPRRNWYIWRDPSERGRLPNNWEASFGGSAWEFDPTTGQCYLHSFLKQQPDVNWRNPELRQALLDVFRFWLDRGVDGFRLDVFNAFFKDSQFRDNPPKFGLRAFDRQEHIYDINQPEMIGLLQELRGLLDRYPERYSVGETYVTPPDKAITYVGDDRLHAAFSFDFFQSDMSFPWNPRWLLERITRRDRLFDLARSQPTTVMGNHDKPRTASRYSRTESDHNSFIAMTLLLTLRGTPFMYYGEEIGMRDISLSRKEIMDPPGKKYWPIYKGRDGCRSPMQWCNAPHAGFSNTTPWLKIHPNYVNRNVDTQQEDTNSLLNFTQKMIALRRRYAALRSGSFSIICRVDSGVLAYERKLGQERILVFINFTGSSHEVQIAVDLDEKSALILLDNNGRKDFSAPNGRIVLSPYEVLLLNTNSSADRDKHN